MPIPQFPNGIPESIGDLTELNHLTITQGSSNAPELNVRSALPSPITKLKKLTSLIIRESNLSGRLPYDIGKLISLKTIDLQLNVCFQFLYLFEL